MLRFTGKMKQTNVEDKKRRENCTKAINCSHKHKKEFHKKNCMQLRIFFIVACDDVEVNYSELPVIKHPERKNIKRFKAVKTVLEFFHSYTQLEM